MKPKPPGVCGASGRAGPPGWRMIPRLFVVLEHASLPGILEVCSQCQRLRRTSLVRTLTPPCTELQQPGMIT
jgi:hypothetical protein